MAVFKKPPTVAACLKNLFRFPCNQRKGIAITTHSVNKQTNKQLKILKILIFYQPLPTIKTEGEKTTLVLYFLKNHKASIAFVLSSSDSKSPSTRSYSQRLISDSTRYDLLWLFIFVAFFSIDSLRFYVRILLWFEFLFFIIIFFF